MKPQEKKSQLTPSRKSQGEESPKRGTQGKHFQTKPPFRKKNAGEKRQQLSFHEMNWARRKKSLSLHGGGTG